MLSKLSRDWLESPRGWVTPPRPVGEFMFAARLEPAKGNEFKMVVAGRSKLTGHVVTTPFKTFPTREQMNSAVNDAEEVLTRYLQSYAYNLEHGFPDADEAFDEPEIG